MRRTGITSVLGICLLLLAAGSGAADKVKPIETFTAFGVHMSSGAASAVTIAIERWSSEEERQALLGILKEQGQAALTAALYKLPRVGYIRLPDTMGYDLKYARSTQNPDGSRRVIVASDRILRFREAALLEPVVQVRLWVRGAAPARVRRRRGQARAGEPDLDRQRDESGRDHELQRPARPADEGQGQDPVTPCFPGRGPGRDGKSATRRKSLTLAGPQREKEN
jgi:hypothetical protein